MCEKGFFLKFFSPYCGHCKNMAAEWEKFNESVKDQVHVGSVDCTGPESKQICNQFDIRAYPTMIYFPPSPFLFDDEIPSEF